MAGAKFDSLILVPCHSVFLPWKAARSKEQDMVQASATMDEMCKMAGNDNNWILETFQKGEGIQFVKQVEDAVELLKTNQTAILCFSGGQTRPEAGPLAESVSYFLLAEYLGMLTSDLRARVVVEDFARDSIENLAFGIARFEEFTGLLPESITIVGWPFKEERFLQHAAALNITTITVKYVGSGTPVDAEGALRGEAKTVALFADDPYGNRSGGGLMEKRRKRNPFNRRHPYTSAIVASLIW